MVVTEGECGGSHAGRKVFPRYMVASGSGKGMGGPKKVLCAETHLQVCELSCAHSPWTGGERRGLGSEAKDW